VGILGWPVAHSLSPAMHDAAFRAMGMDWRYELLACEPAGLEDEVRSLASRGFAGANVTLPHKRAVMDLLDGVDDEAEAIGAVNTLVVEEGGAIHGRNTDAAGFLAHLAEEEVEVGGARVLVCGAGGSARAVVHALCSSGAGSLTIMNRTPSAARDLAASAVRRFPSIRADHSDLSSDPGDADLVVNCTTLGMAGTHHPLAGAAYRPGQVVYDLVYAPACTPLVERARGSGARGLSGLGMLVHQGALAFEMWTGRKPSLEVMRCAIQDGQAR
jgi:shikimate dehydrogenase